MEQETKICSNCKRAINIATFDLHESHCVRHIKLCSVCAEPVPVREMEEHFRDHHAPTPCDKCGQKIPPDQMEEHLEQSCAEVKVECKYCELEVRRADYHEHIEQCGSRTDFCELCNQRVMLKEMSEHKLMKCGHMRAESPLQRYQLEGMGLVGQDGGESDSSDDYNPAYYPPHGIGHSAGPPPAYEDRNDDSMHVDPHWLQTVAQACGEDNLDALLAQNVFFENMRSARSGGHHVTSEPVVSHDNHVTTEESSEDEGSIVQEKPRIGQDVQGDNHVLDEDFARQLVATNEQDDYFFAQKMQEREVMGHSKTLYEEERVRDIAKAVEREKGERDIARDVEEEREEEVKSKVGRTEYRIYEEEIAVKQVEVEELAKKLKESTESQRLLQQHIEETKGEIESLRLATQLQKEDLAEGHKALWKKTAHNSQLADESLARRLQMNEDRLQYSHTHLEEEEPRSKTPPTQSYADDSSEKIPCQWCDQLIPFEQVMLHQQSCYNNLFGGGILGGRGPHLSEDTLRRMENDDELYQAQQFTAECQYCHDSVSTSNLTTHEALCEANPDIHLKNFYGSRQLPSSTSVSSAMKQEPSLSSSGTSHQVENSDDTMYQAQQFSVECEYCHVSVPVSSLSTHEAFCDANPNKFYESHPSSAIRVPARRDPSLSSTSAGLTLKDDVSLSPHTSTEPEGGATASTTLLSVEKGPCEFCHQVIPLAQLVRHEARCKYSRPKHGLAPPTSSQHSPAPPPSSPTLLQGNSATATTTSIASAAMTPSKRSLAIKFPPKDPDTTAHPIEERGGGTKRLDPVIKPASLVANSSASHGPLSLSSLPEKGEEFKGSKKRQSPCENFEPWSGVREPVKKAPRTAESSFISHSNSVLARSSTGSSKSNHSAKSKPVYASANGKFVHGANSIERGGNVLSSAAGGITKQGKDRTDPKVKSLSAGMKELALHSKSETESKSLSIAKPSSSNRSPALKTKSLQAGHSKFPITGTKVSGTNSSPHFSAGRTTGTKSLSSSSSKSHSNANRTDLKTHGVSSQSSSLGASSATTKQTVAVSSMKGRGRERGREENTSSSIRVSRQSSSSGSTVSKGKGRGVGSPSTLHSTSTGRDTKSKPKHVHKTGNNP